MPFPNIVKITAVFVDPFTPHYWRQHRAVLHGAALLVPDPRLVSANQCCSCMVSRCPPMPPYLCPEFLHKIVIAGAEFSKQNNK